MSKAEYIVYLHAHQLYFKNNTENHLKWGLQLVGLTPVRVFFSSYSTFNYFKGVLSPAYLYLPTKAVCKDDCIVNNAINQNETQSGENASY